MVNITDGLYQDGEPTVTLSQLLGNCGTCQSSSGTSGTPENVTLNVDVGKVNVQQQNPLLPLGILAIGIIIGAVLVKEAR